MKHSSSSKMLVAALAVHALGCEPTASPTADTRAAPRQPLSAEASAEALTTALREPDPYARARNLGALLPGLGPDAVPAIQGALEHFRLGLGAVEFELMLRFWATQDPAAATHWVFKKGPPLYRISAARTVFEVWAEADPAAAVVAVQSATAEASEDIQRVGQLALVTGWFKRDPEGLEKYIEDLGSSVERQRSIFGYALSVAAADGSDAAIAWGESVSEDDVRYKREVYQQVMSALSWADPPAAVRFCDRHCDGNFGRGLRNLLVRTRLRNGDFGGDVVEWVAAVPEESEEQRKNKKHSLWVAYATWGFGDRLTAIEWMKPKLEAPEPLPWVRQLIGEYARLLAAASPPEGIPWAEKIEDPAERELNLTRIARAWLLKDEAAAEAWLAQSPLSEAAREKARNTKLPTYLPQVPEES